MVAATGARLLEGEEAREADVVVVSGHRGFDYGELLTAKLALDRGAALFATSHDPTMPYPGGELPGTGRGAGRGRESPRATAPRSPASRSATCSRWRWRRSLFLSADGDQKEQANGRWRWSATGSPPTSRAARRAGLETILVLSGTTSREEAEAADPAPDHVLEDLAGLLA